MATIDEQFEAEAAKFEVKRDQAVANIKKAMAELGQVCEEHGLPYTYRFDDQFRVQYTPKTIKRWKDVSEELKDEYDAWGNHYGGTGWTSSQIC